VGSLILSMSSIVNQFTFRLCWYVGDKFLRDLKSSTGVTLPTRVLVSMLALAEFLVSEARILERGSEQAKKEAKEQIPSERIKDASAMARELRWRLKLATGYSSDDDRPHANRKGREGMNGNKRMRIDSGSSDQDSGRFRNFMPKSWDRVVEKTRENETVRMRVGNGEDQWAGWGEEDGEEVEVKRQRETVVKVRRTLKGVERQRIERVVEEWVWDD
jgi:F-box and leucine-rich repeat protein 10/11